MNNHTFYANLSACIFLNDEDFNFIFECAEHHYDRTVRESANVGGFLYGNRNRRIKFYPEEEITDECRVIELKNRELQLVLKSIEFSKEEKSVEIYGRLFSILKELVEKQNEINKNFQ